MTVFISKQSVSKTVGIPYHRSLTMAILTAL